MKRTTMLLFAFTAFMSTVALAQAKDVAAVLNPNLAKAEELAALPHMYEDLVTLIVGVRPFHVMTDLDGVLRGALSDTQRADLYDKMFLPVNLNTASEAEIMLIPGMSKRMAHEFEEYRPYENMEQFRREIGKYVDAAEVARFERYVTLD